MITILIAAYLLLGAFAFALIWMALQASKRRDNRAKNVSRERLETTLLRESRSKPSGFRS
jgi:hypothetical protein